MSDPTGGSAFPYPESAAWPKSDGMTLLDYFAGQALGALIQKVPLHDRLGEHGIHTPTAEEIHRVRLDIAESAYDYATAMLAERNRRASE